MNSLIKLMQSKATISWNAAKFLFNSTSIDHCAAYSTTTPPILAKAGDIFNISEKPKRPLNAYLRFLNELRPQLSSKISTVRDISKEAAQQWKILEGAKKQQYQKQYEDEKQKYEKALAVYKSKLTDEQKEALRLHARTVRREKKLANEHRQHKKLLVDLGKPKRPRTAFWIFIDAEQKREQLKGNLPKHYSEKWQNLNEEQRKSFNNKYDALYQRYHKELEAWEAKMIKKGHPDIIRKAAKSHDGEPKKPKETKLKKE